MLPRHTLSFRRIILLAVGLTVAAAILGGCKSTALMAPSGDFIYYAAGATPAFPPGAPTVRKVSVGTLEETAGLTLSAGGSEGAGLLSPDGSVGYIIYQQSSGPMTISKVATADLRQLDQAALTVSDVNAAVISPDGAFAYLGDETGTVTEVRLADLVETRHLTTGSDSLLIHAATIAPDGVYAYFGASLGTVVKVRLADLAVVGRATLPAQYTSTAVISPDGQYGYYTNGPAPTLIVKVRLADMAVIDDEPLSIDAVASTVISPDGQYAYVMGNTNPAALLTVRLADLKETRSETVDVDGNAGWSVIAPNGQFAYLGSGDGVYNVKQVRLASPHNLTVAKDGTGAGTVSSTTPGIDCGSVCTRSYLDYQSVTLTATAAKGSTFAGWTGSCTGAAPTCTLAMSEARSVTATFSRPANAFTAKTPTISTTNSTIAITTVLQLPGPGIAKVSSTGVARKRTTLCSTKKTATRAGTYTLTCLIGKRARLALSRGALRLTVATTFAPTGGSPKTTTRSLVLPRTPLTASKPVTPVTG
jgi:hypothetical protein